MAYTGPERRKHPRIGSRFIVSYRIWEGNDDIDISETKNLSSGGMLLTTNIKFAVGTKLALEIRLPFEPRPIMLVGEVEESREVKKGLIYDTRLMFLSVDEAHKKTITDTITYYLRRR